MLGSRTGPYSFYDERWQDGFDASLRRFDASPLRREKLTRKQMTAGDIAAAAFVTGD